MLDSEYAAFDSGVKPASSVSNTKASVKTVTVTAAVALPKSKTTTSDYNNRIWALANSGDLTGALLLLEEMKQDSSATVSVDRYTFQGLMHACGVVSEACPVESDVIEVAKALFEEAESGKYGSRVKADSFIYSKLIAVLVRGGEEEEAI